MIKQTIHIIDFKVLYNILDEIKDYLKFQILHYKNEEIFLNSNDLNCLEEIVKKWHKIILDKINKELKYSDKETNWENFDWREFI